MDGKSRQLQGNPKTLQRYRWVTVLILVLAVIGGLSSASPLGQNGAASMPAPEGPAAVPTPMATGTIETAEGYIARYATLPTHPAGQPASPTQAGSLTGGLVLPPTAAPEPTPLPWDGKERVTILVLGVDSADWESKDRRGPPRTDTMILLTVNPADKTAGMLSIPRDLWVDIPGMIAPNKINAAYRFGELYHLPGGGAGLAAKTVEQVLGVPVNYYVRLDFNAFVQLIDEIGGVKIDVPQEITIDLVGSGGQTKKTLQPGVQTLPGDWALAYARARHTEGGDFARATRQQQVIAGVRERILKLNMLPTLILKAPTLLRLLGSGVQTNLPLDKAIRLAWLAKDIPAENIQSAVIGSKEVVMDRSEDGQSIARPIPERIALLVEQVFRAAPGKMDSAPSLEARMQAEEPRLAIIDATGKDGLAQRTAKFLAAKGLQVSLVAPANKPAKDTRLLDFTGKPYTDQYLAKLMFLSTGQIEARYAAGSSYDVVLVLGSNWAYAHVMD